MVNQPERKSPPNYSSRGMQFRLMVLVASLMIVLVAMDEARKPENWAWMGFKNTEQTSTGPVDSEVSPRLADLFSPHDNANSLFQAMAESTLNSDDEPPTEEQAAADLVEKGTLERILLPLFRSLDNEQRWKLTQILDSIINTQSWTQDDAADRTVLAERITSLTAAVITQLHDEAVRAAVAELPPSETAVDTSTIKTEWDELLQEMTARCQLLAKVVEQGAFPEDATVGDIESLTETSAAWNSVLMSQIEDLSIGLRKDELTAWFRMAQQLERWQASGEKVEPVPVSNYELAQQPNLYRGKWVQIKGDVRRVDRVAVPPAFESIAPGWLLLIRPSYGPDNVISVYCRDLPEKFPRPSADQTSLEMQEPIEIDAVFFKREGYQATDVTRVTARLIGNLPAWTRKAEPETANREINGTTLTLIVVFNLVLAIGVAWWAARTTRRKQKPEDELPPTLKLWIVAISLAASGFCSSTSAQDLPPWLMSEGAEQQASLDPQKLFEDWPKSELDRLGDALPLTTSEPLGFEIMERLATVGPMSLARAATTLDASLREKLLSDPSAHRLSVIRARGVLETVEILELDELTASEFDRQVVYRVVIAESDESDASEPSNRTVAWCEQLPASWLEGVPQGDEVEITGIFLRLERVGEEAEGEAPVPLLIATLPAWLYQGEANDPRGLWIEQGIDRGLWDAVAEIDGSELRAEDGRALYRILNASKTLNADAKAFEQLGSPKAFDLFAVLSDSETHLGEFVRFEGRIKRISEIGTGSDLFARDAGIDRYYQIDMLVSLQGNEVRLQSKDREATVVNTYPVTLCTTRLPEGMSPAPELDVSVFVEGIFYRNWRFQSAYLRDVDPTLRQVAPLVVAIKVTPTGVETQGRDMLTAIASAFCIIGLGGTMVVFAWLKWSDGRYKQQATEAKRAALPDRIEIGPISAERDSKEVSDP